MASLHTGLQCYQPYESRNVKNKAETNGGKRRAEHSRRRPSSVVRTRRRRSVCDGLDIIRRRGGQPPRQNPLVITSCSAAVDIVGQKRRVFLLKTDTNPYPWPYPTYDAGSWPQPTHEWQKTRGLWPRSVCPGSFGRTLPETIGDSRTEFNRILCTSKSEAAATSNKKLRCMLKLTTDKHEASRGLSATAELLVLILLTSYLDFAYRYTGFLFTM